MDYAGFLFKNTFILSWFVAKINIVSFWEMKRFLEFFTSKLVDIYCRNDFLINPVLKVNILFSWAVFCCRNFLQRRRLNIVESILDIHPLIGVFLIYQFLCLFILRLPPSSETKIRVQYRRSIRSSTDHFKRWIFSS